MSSSITRHCASLISRRTHDLLSLSIGTQQLAAPVEPLSQAELTRLGLDAVADATTDHADGNAEDDAKFWEDFFSDEDGAKGDTQQTHGSGAAFALSHCIGLLTMRRAFHRCSGHLVENSCKV